MNLCANMFLTDLHFAACNKLNRRLHSIRRLRRSVTVLCDFYSHFFCCSCCCFILFIISCCCSHSQTLHFKMMKEKNAKTYFFFQPDENNFIHSLHSRARHTHAVRSSVSVHCTRRALCCDDEEGTVVHTSKRYIQNFSYLFSANTAHLFIKYTQTPVQCSRSV